jgi:hypothetical protein
MARHPGTFPVEAPASSFLATYGQRERTQTTIIDDTPHSGSKASRQTGNRYSTSESSTRIAGSVGNDPRPGWWMLPLDIGGRQAMIVGISHFSLTTGCHLIAEGVETKEAALTLS